MLGFGKGSPCQNLLSTHVDFAVLDVCGVAVSFLAGLAPFTALKTQAIFIQIHMTSSVMSVRHNCSLFSM